MLTQLNLKNFKCFEVLKLPICPLTLLTGTNASGKSSIIQALVLLHQTMREHEWSNKLMLNGDGLKLGSVRDVVDQLHRHENIEIGLSYDDGLECNWTFKGQQDEMSMQVRKIKGDITDNKRLEINEQDSLHYLLPSKQSDLGLIMLLHGLTYLTSERSRTGEMHAQGDYAYASVGGSIGENMASVLHAKNDHIVIDGLVFEDTAPVLNKQTEAWMRHFFPGFHFANQKVQGAKTATLGVLTSDKTERYRPINTGSGITQIMPIVVAVLSSQQNSIILVENPETHLHPAGQSKMGEFLARAAGAGVQVILKTHSEHILNGIRRAVKNMILPPNDVALHYFRPREDVTENGGSQVQSMPMNAKGDIDNWPEGFFDQFEKDISQLIDWD